MIHHKIKNILFILVFILTSPLGLMAQNGFHIQFKETALKDIITRLESSYHVTFAYDDAILNEKKISISIDNLTLKSALVKLFRNTEIGFDFFSEKEIVLKKEVHHLSWNSFKKTISGKIVDANSNIPLPFVNIHIKNTNFGTSSDKDGNFSLNCILLADDKVIFSYIGYEDLELLASKLDEFHEIKLRLDPNMIQEVVIKDHRIESLFSNQTKQGSTFDVNAMEKLSTGVERDVFQTLQLIPGVYSANESASDLNVRGGNSGQNLVLFDAINLYHFGHFFGKVSAVNPNYVDKISFYKESASAKYGGRVSSVIDIHGKQEIVTHPHISLETSLISANAVIETPILKNKLGLVLGGRRSFTDIYGSKTYDQLLQQVFQNTRLIDDVAAVAKWDTEEIVSLIPDTYFEDYNAKLIWKPSKKDRFDFNYLFAKDILVYSYNEETYRDVDSLDIRNWGMNGTWNHHWNAHSNTKVSTSYTSFLNDYQYFNNEKIDSNHIFLENGNDLSDFSINASQTFTKDNQNLVVGYQFNQISEEIKVQQFYGNYRGDFFEDTTAGITHSIFADYQFSPSKKMVFNVGGRLSHYDLTHEFYMEPRFFISANPFGHFKIMVAGGIYNQTINKIESYNQLEAENYFWILSRTSDADNLEKFSVVRNRQYSMSFSSIWKGWRWSIGGYDKILDNVAAQTVVLDAGTLYSAGQITSKGLEVSLSKKRKQFHTYLAYTLSRSQIKFPFQDEPILTPYDQLHRFSFSQSYSYKNLTFSLLWSLASGKPYSKAIGIESNADDHPHEIDYWPKFNSYNSDRLEYYSRLDVSLHYFFKIKSTKGKLTFSILNVLNRANYLRKSFYVQYPEPEENLSLELKEINKLGLRFAPNVGVVFFFGKDG